MNTTDYVDIAYKTGSGRYIQEDGALSQLVDEVQRLGSKAYVIGGANSFHVAKQAVVDACETHRLPFVLQEYKGPNSYEAARQFGKAALQSNCDVVVGIGGGRIMDLAKAIAAIAHIGLVEMPTSMATCAAFTPLSVMYTNEGAFKNTWRYEQEVDAVLVDLNIMAHQPPRLVAAGILDAMAKVHEIAHGSTDVSIDKETIERYSAYKYAQVNNEILQRYGKQAYDDVKNGHISKALDAVTFVNIALTGIVSSLTKGYHQTALAHKLYDGLRTLYQKETAHALHGELVAIGLVMQVVYNGNHEYAESLRAYMHSLNMSCTLEEVGIDISDRKRLLQLQNYVENSEFVALNARSHEAFDRAFNAILHKRQSSILGGMPSK